jgi:uncharacterized membrane protein YqjE
LNIVLHTPHFFSPFFLVNYVDYLLYIYVWEDNRLVSVILTWVIILVLVQTFSILLQHHLLDLYLFRQVVV